MRVITLSLLITCSLRIAHSRAKHAITFAEQVSCENLTYCTKKPKDYPQEKFNEIFKSHTVLHRPSPLIEFPNRVKEDKYDVGGKCTSNVEYTELYQVRKKPEDAWETVVQVPKIKFTQKVRMEICASTKENCFAAFPGRGMYEVGCSQQYMSWNILVYNNKTNGTKLINANVPSCCSCRYRDSA